MAKVKIELAPVKEHDGITYCGSCNHELLCNEYGDMPVRCPGCGRFLDWRQWDQMQEKEMWKASNMNLDTHTLYKWIYDTVNPFSGEKTGICFVTGTYTGRVNTDGWPVMQVIDGPSYYYMAADPGRICRA